MQYDHKYHMMQEKRLLFHIWLYRRDPNVYVYVNIANNFPQNTIKQVCAHKSFE